MPRKWGQHFLRFKTLSEKIVSFGELKEDDTVLEIGPGRGILTEEIYKRTKNIIAVEVDKNLYEEIKIKYPDIKIVNADILKIDIFEYINGDFKIISNLPYKISSPFVLNLIEKWKDRVLKSVVLLQKELAERLVFKCGSKKYSPLGIYLRIFFEPKILFHLSPGNFNPPPKVDSSVVLIDKRKTPLIPIENPREIKNFLDKIFSQRRKVLKNNLTKEEVKILNESEKFKEFLRKRAEEIPEETIFEIFFYLKEKNETG